MKLKNNIYNKRKNDNKNKKNKSNQSTNSIIIDKLVEFININNFD